MPDGTPGSRPEDDPKAIAFALGGEREELLVKEIAWSRDHHMAVIRKVKDDDRDWRYHVDF